jgi:membrane protein involved in colicin uptake
MTNKVLYINVETGIEELRDQTAEELAQREADAKAFADAKAAEANAKAVAKAAAEAKLAALGLTADDLKALGLGGN